MYKKGPQNDSFMNSIGKFVKAGCAAATMWFGNGITNAGRGTTAQDQFVMSAGSNGDLSKSSNASVSSETTQKASSTVRSRN